MNDEQQNVFQKRQARLTLTEDRLTKFDKNDQARAKRLSDTTERDARVKRNAAQRTSWCGPGRAGGVKTASGVALDSQTAKLKTAAESERRSQASPPAIQTPPSPMTIASVILTWERENPDWSGSEFNSNNLKNFWLSKVAAGELDFSYESLDFSYRWLLENGYMESAPRPRKLGDLSMSSAPKVFPAFLSAAERSAQLDHQRVEDAQRMSKEIEKAFSMPFKDLQRQVRAAQPNYGREAVR